MIIFFNPAVKAQQAARQSLPEEGTVLITVSLKDRPAVYDVARQFAELGFKILSTQGTRKFLAGKDVNTELILKMHEGRPNIVDAIMNGEIQLVINTPSGKLSQYDDFYIRKTAIKYKVRFIDIWLRQYISFLATNHADFKKPV